MEINKIIYDTKTKSEQIETLELSREEISQREKSDIILQISKYKTLLSESDYKAIKFGEGELTEEEYREDKELRRSYRKEINRLEELLKNI